MNDRILNSLSSIRCQPKSASQTLYQSRFSLLQLVLTLVLLVASPLSVDASRRDNLVRHQLATRRHRGGRNRLNRDVTPTTAAPAASSPSSLTKSSNKFLSSISTIRAGGATAKASGRSTSSAVIVGIKNFIASGCAAGCSKLILAPFDTIKTLQQHQRYSASSAATLSFMEAAQTIMKRPRGVWELYVRFTFCGSCKRQWKPEVSNIL